MPTLKQNLNILKNGVQKRGSRDEPRDFGLGITLVARDHYERWSQYYKRQYPKRKQIPWADTEILGRATATARDTPLGVIDTVTREYITYWMPEIMLFVVATDEESDNDKSHVLTYKSLIRQVRRNVLDVLGRIDCGGDQAARTLATILKERTEDRLDKLFLVFEDQLTEEEKHEYGSRKVEVMPSKNRKILRKTTSTTLERVSEARILDSSLAWRLSDIPNQPKPSSPKKRRYSEMKSSPGPDPADNGQVWDSPQLDFKRQKFDFTFTSTIKHSQNNELTVLSPHKADGSSLQGRDTVDLTEDGDGDAGLDQNTVRARDGVADARDSWTPLRKDGQCVLM